MTRNEALRLGLKTYSTGSPCNRGHLSERYASTGNCIACHNGNAFKVSRYAPPEILAPIEAKRDALLAQVDTEIATIDTLMRQLQTKRGLIVSNINAELSAANAAYVTANQGNVDTLYQEEATRRTQMQALKRFTDFRVPLLTEAHIDRMLDIVIEHAGRRGVELTRDQAYIKSDSIFSYYRCHPEDKLALVAIGNAMYQPVITPPQVTQVLAVPTQLSQYVSELDAAEDTTPPESNL